MDAKIFSGRSPPLRYAGIPPTPDDMIGLLISAGILFALLHFMAKDEAEIHFGTLVLICLGVSILNLALTKAIGYFALPAVLAGLAWALHQFCYLRWSKAIAVTLVYLVVGTGISFVLH